METPKIGVIIGTVREGRFADRVVEWFMEIAKQRSDMTFELIDLKDYPLPLFDEAMPPAMGPSEKPVAVRWREKLGELDGYIFTAAEYNNSVPGVLKNAIDYVSAEWARKPAAFIGYGGAGGARSIQHLRHIATELQMAPNRYSVNIMGGDFMALWGGQTTLQDLDHLSAAAAEMLDDFAWWAKALKSARDS